MTHLATPDGTFSAAAAELACALATFWPPGLSPVDAHPRLIAVVIHATSGLDADEWWAYWPTAWPASPTAGDEVA